MKWVVICLCLIALLQGNLPLDGKNKAATGKMFCLNGVE